MTLDLFLVGLVLLFAAVGAATGAARQVASLAAAVAAYLFTRPIGNAFGPQVAASMHVPLLFGILAATLVAFVVVLVSVRYLLTGLLRRLLQGRDRERASVDGLLGFLMGGAKVALVAYVMLSALAFAEDNVSIAGARLGLSPRDSQAFALARRYNLFATTQFAPVKDLVRLSQALKDPDRAQQLRKDPAFQALLTDPRFRAALSLRDAGTAQDTASYSLLLRNNNVLQLVQDRVAAARLAAAADSADRTSK